MPCTLSKVELHVLWRECSRYVASLAQAVRELKRVDEASYFCRWLRFTGLLGILTRNSVGLPLPVDGLSLEREVKELTEMCGEIYKGGKVDPKYSSTDIGEINRKLEVLAVAMSHLAPQSVPVIECEPVRALLERGVESS
jgi:hypothetical protein